MPGPGTLIIFAGLPGTGKTTLARELAVQLAGLYLRIDTLEQAIRDSIFGGGRPVLDAGYAAAYSIATENLRLGRTVVADSVNPLQITREAWRATARGLDAKVFEVEVICSNADEHRRRVETRAGDVPNLSLPTWQDVVARDYEPWDRPVFRLDTANSSIERSLQALRAALGQ